MTISSFVTVMVLVFIVTITVVISVMTIVADVAGIADMCAGPGQSGFHCIVLDPPWENKSAKRGSKYPTLPSRNLKGIPMQKLLHQVGFYPHLQFMTCDVFPCIFP